MVIFKEDDCMNKIASNMSDYLHAYEAYRIPKGTIVKDPSGKDVVLSNEEDVLVLTEAAGRQLVQDRRDHNGMLQQKAEVAALETQKAAIEKMMKDQAKALAVYRIMAKGDFVPAGDEMKLQQYSSELYQAAKMAQAMAQLSERKQEKSQWDEKEEAKDRAKMEELSAASNEAATAVVKGSHEFISAQKANIVEIDSADVDFSAMKVMNLGGGVTGAHIDLSL